MPCKIPITGLSDNKSMDLYSDLALKERDNVFLFYLVSLDFTMT